MAEKLKIIPLGGLDEIGKNITVLEYGKDMIVVDCALRLKTRVKQHLLQKQAALKTAEQSARLTSRTKLTL